MKKHLLSSLCLLGFLAFLLAPMSAFAADGKKLYTEKLCVTCHGVDGNASSPQYPNLSGQNKLYMTNQFKAIVSSKRKLGATVVMRNNPKVAKLSDAELDAITTYLAGLKRSSSGTVATDAQIALGKKKYKQIGCKQCHGVDGKGMPKGSPKKYLAYPKLNGQHAVYVYNQLNAILGGKRVNDSAEIMAKQLKKAKLNKKSLKALSAYIAQVK